MIKGFKEFILRGNVIDLAVAVVIGAAFTAVVNAIVSSVITPLISVFYKPAENGEVGPSITGIYGQEVVFPCPPCCRRSSVSSPSRSWCTSCSSTP